MAHSGAAKKSRSNLAAQSAYRGMQTHKKLVELGLPGSRLAINLTGVHPDQLIRGHGSNPAWQRTTHHSSRCAVDAGSQRVIAAQSRCRFGVRRLRWLFAPQPGSDFFSGAAEVPARLRLLDAEAISPGSTGWASCTSRRR